jgi:hypothetical protein
LRLVAAWGNREHLGGADAPQIHPPPQVGGLESAAACGSQALMR